MRPAAGDITSSRFGVFATGLAEGWPGRAMRRAAGSADSAPHEPSRDRAAGRRPDAAFEPTTGDAVALAGAAGPGHVATVARDRAGCLVEIRGARGGDAAPRGCVFRAGDLDLARPVRLGRAGCLPAPRSCPSPWCDQGIRAAPRVQ